METPVPITAGYATTGQGAGPMVVTVRAGLFEKHGLDVKDRIMGSAKAVVRGLKEGEIQFGNLASPALLRANISGEADLVFLTGGINQQFVMGRPGIEALEELEGGGIGFVGDGGLNDILVRFVLEEWRKKNLQGIRLVPLKGGGGRRTLEGLLSGRCDAAVITPPDALEAKRKGCQFLVDFSDYGLNYALGGIAAARSYVTFHQDIARKFVKAYVEGMHRYRTDRDFTVKVQQEYSGIQDRSIAEETYDITQPGMPRVPYPRVEALRKIMPFLSEDTAQAPDADPASFVDDRMIRELEESGFIASLYQEAE